jgi:hypothetical protein
MYWISSLLAGGIIAVTAADIDANVILTRLDTSLESHRIASKCTRDSCRIHEKKGRVVACRSWLIYLLISGALYGKF